MKKIMNYNENVFESIKHIDKFGNEFWYACEKSNYLIVDHFSQVGKMVSIDSKTSRNIVDY